MLKENKTNSQHTSSLLSKKINIDKTSQLTGFIIQVGASFVRIFVHGYHSSYSLTHKLRHSAVPEILSFVHRLN